MMEIMMMDLRAQMKIFFDKSQPQPYEEITNIWESLSLPVDTEEELLQLEDFLKEAENAIKSVSYVAILFKLGT